MNRALNPKQQGDFLPLGPVDTKEAARSLGNARRQRRCTNATRLPHGIAGSGEPVSGRDPVCYQNRRIVGFTVTQQSTTG